MSDELWAAVYMFTLGMTIVGALLLWLYKGE